MSDIPDPTSPTLGPVSSDSTSPYLRHNQSVERSVDLLRHLHIRTAKVHANPTKSKFRLGGLVLENSVAQIPSSPEIQFVVSDLITDILAKYEGSLPDLFREGHSVVVEGFIKPVGEESRKKEEDSLGNSWKLVVSEKERNLSFYFSATEVLAKHDEKYMPAEVNKKKLKEEEEEKKRVEPLISADGDGNEKA